MSKICLGIAFLILAFSSSKQASARSEAFRVSKDTCILPQPRPKEDSITEDGIESSGALLSSGAFGGQRSGDSLYANDVILERDVMIPGNSNRVLQLPAFICAGVVFELPVRMLGEGNFEWSLQDKNGRVLYRQEIVITEGAKSIPLKFPLIASGDYEVRLVHLGNCKEFRDRIILK